MLRCGKLQQKVLKPGIHFKIPFLDSVWEATIITQSLEMNPQSITTRNGRNVVVKAIIRFRIEDVKTLIYKRPLNTRDLKVFFPNIKCCGCGKCSINQERLLEYVESNLIYKPINISSALLNCENFKKI